MLAAEHTLEFRHADRALQTERCRPRAHPGAARLGARQVVVLNSRADSAGAGHRPVRLLEVVVGLAGGELSDRQHETVSTRYAAESSARAEKSRASGRR